MRSFRTPGLKVINLAEASGDLVKLQLFRLGTFHHPDYGSFTIDKKFLSDLKKNFDAKVRGIDIALDFNHDEDSIAAGWFKELELSQDGSELFGLTKPTPAGKQKITDEEFRYISPEFVFDYQDNESLKKFGPVLLGAALTNRPCIKRMEPVVELEEEVELGGPGSGRHAGGGSSAPPPKSSVARNPAPRVPVKQQMANAHKDLAAAKAQAAFAKPGSAQHKDAIAKAGRANDRISQLKGKKDLSELDNTEGESKMGYVKGADVSEVTPEELAAMPQEDLVALCQDLLAKVGEMKPQMAELADKVACSEKEKSVAAKEAQFAKLLTDGAAVVAQKEAFMAGDTVKFAELSQKPKTSTAGNAGSAGGETSEKSAEDQVLELAEKLMKEGKAKTKGEAISLALRQLPELNKKIYG